MRRVIFLAALAAVACSKADERIYTEAELGVAIDWAYLGWSEVYNNLDETVTLVTTYPDHSDKTIEKTFVIEPGDFVKMEIGCFAPGMSISESLTATIKLNDGTEILCTNGADNAWSKHFYETFEQRNEDAIVDFNGKKLRHSWLYVTYHIDKSLVDIWQASRIEIDNFLGSWQEYFGPDYHIEGGRTWHIGKDSICVYTYDWYSDTAWEKNLLYTLEQKEGKYIVVLHSEEESETRDEAYYIVKLTDEEMIWQSVDSEKVTRHFVNGKYWQTHQE